MRLTQKLALVFSLILLSACSSTPFQYEYGYTPTKFEELKTYRWAPDKVRRAFPELAIQLVATADEQMADKGYQLIEKGDADFVLSFEITAKPDIDVNSHKVYGGVGLGFTWRRNEGFQKDPLKVEGTGYVAKIVGQGSIIIDAINPETNQVFWRGIASKELDLKTSSSTAEPIIDVAKAKKSVKKATTRIIEQFPPDA